MLGPWSSCVSHLLMEPYWCEHGGELSNFHMFPMSYFYLHNPSLDMKSQHCPIKNSHKPITNQFCPMTRILLISGTKMIGKLLVKSSEIIILRFVNTLKIPMFHDLHQFTSIYMPIYMRVFNPQLSWWTFHPFLMVKSSLFCRRQEAREQREAELRERRAEFSSECKVPGT